LSLFRDVLRSTRSLFWFLLDIYSLGLLIWLGLWRLLGDANGWLALANAWAFWHLLVGIPVGTAALLRRSGWLAALWLAGLTSFFLRHYHRQVNLSQPSILPVEGTERLTLYSANLLNHPRKLDLVLETMLSQQADILLFQESIASHIPQLEQALEDYPHRCWIPYQPTNLGIGVASRLPFAITGFWQDVGLDPYALRVTVALEEGPLDIYCVHCISPAHQIRKWGPTMLLHTREQQVLNLLAAVESRDYPAVLAGDWNATEASDSYRWIRRQLVDGWLEAGAGPGWSWPQFWDKPGKYPARPLLRLDYLFHTGKSRQRMVRVESMQCIITETTSDHCPLVARIALSGAPQQPVMDRMPLQQKSRT
jgi:endonuclease/exonuclease/phosphatase (EEP) superfamily protein YafD